MHEWLELRAALHRARWPIGTVAMTYFLALVGGAVSAQMGNSFALTMRDRIVSRAVARDPAAIAHRKGQRLSAASLDFARNLILGAVPNTIGGLAVVIPYAAAAYRGWVGGIVSVNGKHRSRLSRAQTAVPFLAVLFLQLVPYSIAGGVGVYLGLAYLRQHRGEPRILGLPRQAALDVVRAYAMIIPLFAIASLVEFYTM